MRQGTRGLVVGLGVIAMALPAAQSDVSMPSFTGEWRPVLGAGGVYLAQTAGQPAATWEMTVVGREGEAYWIEMYLPGMEQTVMKSLASPRGVSRVIIKVGNEPAMEMPGSFMADAPKMDVKERGQYIGSEPVTTSAGTFTCEHYRVPDEGGTADVWVTTEVSPYGLVKMTSPRMSMTLQRVITGATTRITETPQKLQMPQMPAGGADLSGLLQGLQGAAGAPASAGRSQIDNQHMPDLSELMKTLEQQAPPSPQRR